MKVIQIFVTNLFQNGQIPFFQLSHSSLIPLSTLFILPIPNYKLPKAICNAIISDRQVLAPSPPPSFNFGLTLRNGNRYPKRRGFCPCSSASCVPDQTWRFIGGIDTDTISRNSALRSAEKVLLPCGTSKRRGGHGLSKAIRARFSPVPITGEAIGFRVTAIYIYIYILRESCRLERIYLSQFGRPQPPKVPVLSVGANVTNFLENFLDFPRTSLFHWWLRFSGGGRCLDSRNCGFNFVVSRNNFFIFFHSLFRDEI